MASKKNPGNFSQVKDLIKTRRSIRAFTEKSVPQDVVKEVLECGRWAPSAGNRQPWHFFAVHRTHDKFKVLSEAAHNQRMFSTARWVILVCAKPERSAARYDDRGRQLYCLQDTAAAVQNMLLALHARGLGGVWIGAFEEEKVNHGFRFDESHRPVAMIALGHPQQQPSPTSRLSLDSVVDFLE